MAGDSERPEEKTKRLGRPRNMLERKVENIKKEITGRLDVISFAKFFYEFIDIAWRFIMFQAM